ncbi:hypothetical protein GKR71_01080 [Providencia sp. wls1922]|uniref:O-antigen flippase n=1 Tax=Providencia alcalifaciens TaxID=126385 RepID=H9XTR0_9GAMM|nr:hypothetical protein [Providencia sp. wls1922]AFH02806.1 O-antigen flippase [Providencia alcalifaciens]MTC44429.1 hypothetical protein [Providencia sp. wls1922]
MGVNQHIQQKLPPPLKNMKRMKILVAASRIYEILLAFLLLKISSDLLSPEEYGKLGLLTTITQGIAWFFLAPLQNFILVNTINANDNGWLKKIIKFEILYSIFISYFCYSILVYFEIIPNVILNNTISLIVFIISVSCPVIIQTLLPILNIKKIHNVFLRISILSSSLGFLLPIIFVKYYEHTYLYWLLGVNLAPAIVIILIILWGYKHSHFNCITNNPIPSKKLMLFCVPLAGAIIFQWFNLQGYRLQLENYFSIYTIGIFIMGFTFCGRFFNAIEKILTTVLMPSIYNRETGVTINDAWLKYLKTSFIVYTLFFLFFMISSEYIFNEIISDQYNESIEFIKIGLIYDYSRCMLNAIYQHNLLTERNKIQLVFNFLISIFIFVSIFITIRYNLSINFFAYTMSISTLTIGFFAFIKNLSYKDKLASLNHH